MVQLILPLSGGRFPTLALVIRMVGNHIRPLTLRPRLLGVALALAGLATCNGIAQSSSPPPESSSTSTDLFVMLGSDFDRPGLLPRANLNIGIGHTFGFLKRDIIGDELTISYTYENADTHGFFHTDQGEHTETLGAMKNFGIPATKVVTGYTWLQGGITSYTGTTRLQNRFYSGVSLGGVIHFTDHHSIWIQESYNKVVTVPWYTTTSAGYTYSW